MNDSVAGHIWLLIIIAIIALMTLLASILKSKDKDITAKFKLKALQNKSSNFAWSDEVKLKSKLGAKTAYQKSTASSVSSKAKTKPNRNILRLNERLKKYFPTMNTRLQHNRIVARVGENKFMLTIDKEVSAGVRQLGDARVINFHSLPSVKELQKLFDAYTNKTTS